MLASGDDRRAVPRSAPGGDLGHPSGRVRAARRSAATSGPAPSTSRLLLASTAGSAAPKTARRSSAAGTLRAEAGREHAGR